MHMRQLDKEILYSLPVKVRFAGFESTTLGLARSGWDLSMEQFLSHYGEHELRLAIRHGSRDCAIYGISHSIRIPFGRIHQGMHSQTEWKTLLDEICFDMMTMNSQNIIFRHEQSTPVFNFKPIDAMTQHRTIYETSIKDFKFFKTVDHDVKDLIVSPDRVPELLDLILKVQKPTQKEIRQREESRANYESYKNGDMFKPQREVMAQIITLAG